MANPSTDNWSQWAEHVLAELTRQGGSIESVRTELGGKIESLQKDIGSGMQKLWEENAKLRTEIALLKFKMVMIGTGASIVGTILIQLAIKFL